MIGTGDVTEKKSGPGFYKAKNSVLYGVTNRTLAKAEDYAKRHHGGYLGSKSREQSKTETK